MSRENNPPCVVNPLFDTPVQKLEFEQIRVSMGINYFDIPARSAIPSHSVTKGVY